MEGRRKLRNDSAHRNIDSQRLGSQNGRLTEDCREVKTLEPERRRGQEILTTRSSGRSTPLLLAPAEGWGTLWAVLRAFSPLFHSIIGKL